MGLLPFFAKFFDKHKLKTKIRISENGELILGIVFGIKALIRIDEKPKRETLVKSESRSHEDDSEDDDW